MSPFRISRKVSPEVEDEVEDIESPHPQDAWPRRAGRIAIFLDPIQSRYGSQHRHSPPEPPWGRLRKAASEGRREFSEGRSAVRDAIAQKAARHRNRKPRT